MGFGGGGFGGSSGVKLPQNRCQQNSPRIENWGKYYVRQCEHYSKIWFVFRHSVHVCDVMSVIILKITLDCPKWRQNLTMPRWKDTGPVPLKLNLYASLSSRMKSDGHGQEQIVHVDGNVLIYLLSV